MRYLKLLTVVALLGATLGLNSSGVGAQENPGSEPIRQLGAESAPVPSLPESTLTRVLSDILPETTPGDEALAALSEEVLADVAAQNGRSVEEMTAVLAEDSAAWLNPDGMLLFMDPPPIEEYLDGPPAEPGPFPNSQTFLLHSRPGASRVVYLDFDGYNLPAGTAWGPAVSTAAFDTDGNPGTFVQAEHDVIQSVWQRVSEDYAPFDVDVTTQDPGYAAINRSSAGDTNYGTRNVITSSPSSLFCPGAGGCAFVGVYNAIGAEHDFFQPAWTFANALGNTAKDITEASSHEVGHNIGLSHDGTTGGTEYYAGHGMWAPIMGVGYSQPVSQWSKGEYANANNTEDDFAVAASFGMPLLADDADCGSVTNDVLSVGAANTITVGDPCDSWRYVAPCTGQFNIAVVPDPGVSPNLSLYAQIYEYSPLVFLQQQANQPVRVNEDVATGMGETLTVNLVKGKEYLFGVFPWEQGTASTGWTNYGNVGRYEIVPFGPGTTSNDTFECANTIGGPADTKTGSNVGYGVQSGEPTPVCEFGADAPVNTAWWEWTAPTTGQVYMDTFGSNFDTILAVYTGTTVGALSQVACNDQSGVNDQSRVNFQATAGTTYRISVDGWSGQSGNITLNTTLKPKIRPFGTAVFEGNNGSQVVNVPVYLEDATGSPFPSTTPVTVDWATTDIPSNSRVAHPGSDFAAASGTVTFAPGQTTATIPITVFGDDVYEPDLLYGEWALIAFSNPSGNARIDPGFFGLGLVIIANDDSPPD